MIAYEIRRPRPEIEHRPIIGARRVPATPPNRPLFLTGDEMRRHRQEQMAEGERPDSTPVLYSPPGWLPRPSYNGQPSGGDYTALGMGKLQYAKWLGEMVTPRFPKGTLVTLANRPYMPGNLPDVFYQVVDIQEIHWNATIDKHTRSPKAIGVAFAGISNAVPMTWYSPGQLRPLNSEEVKQVDRLRNQTAKRAAAAAYVGDDGNTKGSEPPVSGGDGTSRPEEGDI